MQLIDSVAGQHNTLKTHTDPDLIKIISCPKVPLGRWPTLLSSYHQLPNLTVKRDDLSGYGRGGIKVRKLESILAFIENRHYKGIITLVPNISNLRSDLEFYKKDKKNDLSLNLFISNVPVLNPALRKKILEQSTGDNALVGTSSLLISLKMIAKWFKLRKQKYMLILPSLMHPASVMGAAGGLMELYEQYKTDGKVLPKQIFISGCTGSSAAGLILSAEILKNAELADIKINTVKVFPGNMRLWMWMVLRWTRFTYNLNIKVPYSKIIIHSKHSDVPYGASDPALISICKRVKDSFDLDIDPIYGARAWSVMEEFSHGEYKNQDIVYWHCGFTPDWQIGHS